MESQKKQSKVPLFRYGFPVDEKNTLFSSVTIPIEPALDLIVPIETAQLLAHLHTKFEARRKDLLDRRKAQQKLYDAGNLPNELEDTRDIRKDTYWAVAPWAPGMKDRRVEITGPVDAKTIINALNSDATQYMADFEDATSPTWLNIYNGHLNLRYAVQGKLVYVSPEGKGYRLAEDKAQATLIVRPRGIHMIEKHVCVNEFPISASLFDFAVFMFHNAVPLIQQGKGPYFYLPKIETHEEAKWWNDVFNEAQDYLSIPRGTIRATVLIETLPAVFQIDEILYELRHHCAGANMGRWDYIFSMAKLMRNNPQFLLPNREHITMETPFLTAYAKKIISVCHKRCAHAIGGMAAQVPVKNDEKANMLAKEKVYADKLREVKLGCDGTWALHPLFVGIAKQVFNEYMPKDNQVNLRVDCNISQHEILDVHAVSGDITEAGVRNNVVVVLKYITAWLNGIGCIVHDNLMEDAATAEICRTQLWQWIKHGAKTSNWATIDKPFVMQIFNEEMYVIDPTPLVYDVVHCVFEKLVDVDDFLDFITSICYEYL